MPPTGPDLDARLDAVVIGAGQAGLAAGYYLRRAGLRFAILDAATEPGGAWRHTWPSLRLFSPAEYSSLPGWPMPRGRSGENPDPAHVIDYLTAYERRYALPVHRAQRVLSVRATDGGFEISATDRGWLAGAVVSATGTWGRPFVPSYAGMNEFGGRQIHSASYDAPAAFAGQRVLVVGGANSGAQIAADLAYDCAVTWCTLDPPHFLPDDVDGRELFRIASARVRGEGEGVRGLGDIVVVPPVRQARDDGMLRGYRMFARIVERGAMWADGTVLPFDAIIWCTGFRPDLRHLRGITPDLRHGRPRTERSPVVPSVPGLYLLGYGDWCGPASATLIGVGQYAKGIAADIVRRTAPPHATVGPPPVGADPTA